MLNGKQLVGIGIDLGSSSVRVSIFNFENDELLAYKIISVPYYFNSESVNWKYTQSSREILTAIYKCLQDLKISNYDVKSCGVAATCSLAIFQKKDMLLVPWNFDDTDKNVVFWMDSTSVKETREINQRTTLQVRRHMGGNFVPEMAIPKLSHFINHIKESNDISTFEVIDLHRYVAMNLAQKYGWDYNHICNYQNSNKIGYDGELAGWTSEFYEQILQVPANIIIGPIKQRQSVSKSALKVASCIDCYASWFALLSPPLQNSLFVVGGTSTCYLYASSEINHHMPGIWGPFSNVLDASNQFSVYEAGQSCTGKLIEHLFKTHAASFQVDAKQWPHLLNEINEYIEKVEETSQCSIHIQTRHMFFYGDLDGNRTPYADPEMSGMFIGETTDTSFKNLVYKYVCILEFIAFQIKYMHGVFNSLNTKDIKILQFCGSLTKNQRLLQLVNLLSPEVKILVPKMDAALIGSYGSYLMGKSSTCRKSIVEVAHNKSYPYESPKKIDPLVVVLLQTKYRIHIDMAQQQRKYRDQINAAMQAETNHHYS